MPLNEKFDRWNTLVDCEHGPGQMEEDVFAHDSWRHFFPDEADTGQIGTVEGPRLESSDAKGQPTALTFEAGKDRSKSAEVESQPEDLTSEEGDTDFQIGQQTYESIVLQSEAYQRLVSEIKSFSALEWGDHSEASCTNGSVQQAILRKLPTGRISRQHGPRVHVAKFWISRKQARREIKPDDTEENTWTDSMVVIGCGNKAQAISIKSYVFQTWPTTGPAILELFQNLMDGNCKTISTSGYFSVVPELRRRFSLILPDQTGIMVTWGSINWVVTVTGLAHVVAECGQQLAWMVAAIHSTNSEGPARVTPVVVERVRETSVLQGFLSQTRAHAVSFDLDVRDAGVPKSQGKDSSESILGDNPSVIYGFPIRRRTVNSPGLEIPGERLWELARAYSVTTRDNRTYIQAYQMTLTLVKRSGDTLLWHSSATAHDPCECYIDKAVHRNAPCSVSNLKELRHIIDYCTAGKSGSECRPFIHCACASSL